MISEKIKLLESFKQNQFSKLIEKINSKILATLKSGHFNPRLAPYLEKMNKDGVPFTNFDLDPENISQIKKLINALYHARLAFLDLENIDIGNIKRTIPDLKLLYSNTIHQAYQAGYLITNLDVDLQEMFKEEIDLILPVIGKLQAFAGEHQECTKRLAESWKDFPISYKAGEVTGIALEQMQPRTGDWDYQFLTQFSAVLPGYIEKLTQYIQQYSSQIKEKEPTLNNEKLEELQNASLKLLNDLEHLKGNDFFISLKVLKYIHIIRNIITLATSSVEQMGHFSDSSQDVIRDNLAQLKYVVLPTLFGLVDKIEDNAMLKPGTLSIPLMEKIKPLYQLLIYYASKPVNFKEKGEELLSIEDSRFLALRLERTYQRIDEANKALFKIQKAQEALDNFYKILDPPPYNKQPIHQLPKEIKNQLITYYKIISPYMMDVDPDLNILLIDSFQGPESWSSYLKKPWRWLRGTLPADHASFVLAQKEALQTLISKKKATQQFHIELNRDLIESVHKQTNLVLFPYSEKTNVFLLDETKALNPANGATDKLKFRPEKGHNILVNPEDLTSEQALDLYQWYRNKREKFRVASKAYNEFITLLKKQTKTIAETEGRILHLNNLDKETKTRCRNLYNIFQPYFIDGIPPELRASAISFDKFLVHSFSNESSTYDAPAVDLFEKLDEHFQIYFTEIDLQWGKKSNQYLKWAQEKFASENNSTELEHDEKLESRAHHLIKHTNFSKCIHEFRTELNQVISFFNNAMRAQLKQQPNGIPYPELQDHNKELAQSEQVVAIKRIFNSLYHVEKIVVELEKLDTRSYESIYVYHLIQAYDHINEIKKLALKLAVDPHFKLIASELLEKAQTLIATIQEHSDAYQVSPLEVPYNQDIKYNALWYTLNAFYISPKHIRSLRNTNYLTTEELNDLHLKAKKATVTVENIIKSSNSYFKLFLQTPAMYSLYREMTNKLNEFISTSHDAVMNNLDQFRSKIFTPMLMEADAWEDKLGLVPGTISGPLKTITDEYYKGLLHPLALHSKAHIRMICDKTPIDQRIKTTNKKLENATQHLDKIEKNYKHIIKLYEIIKTKGGKTTDDELIETYKKALYKLVKLQKRLPQNTDPDPKDYELDTLLNSELKEYEPKLTLIKPLIISSYHHYEGLKATYLMKANTAREKLTYLKELRSTQEQEDLLYIEEYTTESFNKQLDAFCNRHIGLQYTDKEYRTKLREYLLTFKESIIQRSKSAEDINLTIKNLLKEKIKNFERDNFEKYYHLDAVRVALAQFKNYFSLSTAAIEQNNSTFESEETLAKKTELINKLVDISEDGTLTPKERVDQISFHVKNPNFERIIMDYKQESYFSFTYLKQCILSLLEALCLYTPERRKLFNNLESSVKTQPKINELTKRFGLFAGNESAISSESRAITPVSSVENNGTIELNQLAPSA
ncbi:protein SdhA [Legionella pneumophila]|uniref:Dot/Icm T4SS effector SdhA n=1 Tax=Legionella pneumophila TaxID=446 RepID=UPI00101F8CF5|nr:Dot/Icm T4SS effector SdhA [Legionella pneumophila]RYX25357.1 protein SdhA [Legionella pneumophila]